MMNMTIQYDRSGLKLCCSPSPVPAVVIRRPAPSCVLPAGVSFARTGSASRPPWTSFVLSFPRRASSPSRRSHVSGSRSPAPPFSTVIPISGAPPFVTISIISIPPFSVSVPMSFPASISVPPLLALGLCFYLVFHVTNHTFPLTQVAYDGSQHHPQRLQVPQRGHSRLLRQQPPALGGILDSSAVQCRLRRSPPAA